MSWPARLSVNAQSIDPRGLEELVEACSAAGVKAIGIYRPVHVEPIGFARTKELIKKADLRVSIYSAVGFWASGGRIAVGLVTSQEVAKGRVYTLKDNIEILDEAAELGASIVGGSQSIPITKDLKGARKLFVDGLRELAPYAAERNLRIGIEPMHPIYAPRVCYTLGDAIDLCEEVGHPNVGVTVDTWQQWWEPDLVEQLKRGVVLNRIFLLQVADWSQEMMRTRPYSRALMGEGEVDFDLFVEGLQDYRGYIDIEILRNEELQGMPVPKVLDRLLAAHQKSIGDRLDLS